MRKVTFVIGAPASGKTYFIDHYFAGEDVVVLNIYNYQLKAYDEAGYKSESADGIPYDIAVRCLRKANETHIHDIIEKLKSGRDVVVEHTLYKAKRRISYIDAIRKEIDVKIEIYVIQPSDEQWIENVQKRHLRDSLKHHKKELAALEFPNPAEGFDAIYEVVDGVITKRDESPDESIRKNALEELTAETEQIKREDEASRMHEELLESMNTRPFWHYCEVCGKKEFITAQEAFESGWDYPPQIGYFGILSPRKCGDHAITETLYWKAVTSGLQDLTDEESDTLRRIEGEPESLL